MAKTPADDYVLRRQRAAERLGGEFLPSHLTDLLNRAIHDAYYAGVEEGRKQERAHQEWLAQPEQEWLRRVREV